MSSSRIGPSENLKNLLGPAAHGAQIFFFDFMSGGFVLVERRVEAKAIEETNKSYV